MPSKPRTPPASLAFTNMLFLASHGLQSPLSAIRWGTARLKKLGKDLPKEQQEVIENIQKESKLLSQMFDWMLLLAKVEEGAHVANQQEVFVKDFLSSPDRLKDLPRPFALAVSCPDDLALRIDRTLFESVVQALLLVVSVGSAATKASVTVEEEDDLCAITVSAPLALLLLQQTEMPAGADQRRIVGGAPGFLLAVSASLSAALGGELTPSSEGDAVTGMTFRVPLRPAPVSQ